MGRFISTDPSGLLAQKPAYPGSWNLYAYAMNNPLIFIDPTGLDCLYANDAGNGVESIDHSSNSGSALKAEYVFFDGETVARKDFPSNAVSYYFSDHLKTASVITDAAGTLKAESDYYPWGGELQFVNNDSNHYKLTGKERDTETGLDYFGARYYSNGLGRWVSADCSPTPIPEVHQICPEPIAES